MDANQLQIACVIVGAAFTALAFLGAYFVRRDDAQRQPENQ